MWEWLTENHDGGMYYYPIELKKILTEISVQSDDYNSFLRKGFHDIPSPLLVEDGSVLRYNGKIVAVRTPDSRWNERKEKFAKMGISLSEREMFEKRSRGSFAHPATRGSSLLYFRYEARIEIEVSKFDQFLPSTPRFEVINRPIKRSFQEKRDYWEDNFNAVVNAVRQRQEKINEYKDDFEVGIISIPNPYIAGSALMKAMKKSGVEKFHINSDDQAIYIVFLVKKGIEFGMFKDVRWLSEKPQRSHAFGNIDRCVY